MQEIKIYTTTHCAYCTSAKRLLGQRGLAFEEIDVTSNDQLRQKLSAENKGYRTVPMIFIGQEFIGGYSELASLDQKGDLVKKVQA